MNNPFTGQKCLQNIPIVEPIIDLQEFNEEHPPSFSFIPKRSEEFYPFEVHRRTTCIAEATIT